MKMLTLRLTYFLVFVLSMFAVHASASDLLAGDETGFVPFVEVSVTSDSNVYRAESDLAIYNAFMDDLIAVNQASDNSVDAAVGFEMATETAAQRLELDARIERQAYQDLSSLDYTGGDARLLWVWQPVDYWNGRVRGSYEKMRRSFENRLDLLEDIREKKRIGVESRFLHRGNWLSQVSVDFIDTAFEEEETLDKQRVVVEVGAHKLGERDDNYYGAEVRLVDAQFDRISDADYQQQELAAVLDWQLTGKTHVHALLGWTRRDLEESSSRSDYSGVTGRLTVNMQFNEALAFETEAYRRISNLSDDIADYTEISGIRVAPTIALGARTEIGISAMYEKRDFDGTNRKDDVYGAGADVRWKFSNKSHLSVGYQYQQKDSNEPRAEYDAHTVSVGVLFAI